MCRQVQDLRSVVRGEIERLEQDLKSKKEELAQLVARREVLEASDLALKGTSQCSRDVKGCLSWAKCTQEEKEK